MVPPGAGGGARQLRWGCTRTGGVLGARLWVTRLSCTACARLSHVRLPTCGPGPGGGGRTGSWQEGSPADTRAWGFQTSVWLPCPCSSALWRGTVVMGDTTGEAGRSAEKDTPLRRRKETGDIEVGPGGSSKSSYDCRDEEVPGDRGAQPEGGMGE